MSDRIARGSVADDLERVHRFEREIELAGTEEVPSPLGFAVLTDELPLRHDSNFLFLEQDVATEDAVAEVDRILGGGGRDYRVILTFDEGIGERLRPDFDRLGWRTMRHVFMVQRRSPEKTADVSVVSEVDQSALRPGRRREILAQPWGTPELAEELLDSKLHLARRAETRFFGVEIEGEIVAWTDLYVAQGVAQIEDVATVHEYRQRGYATACVLHAADEGRKAGADLVFLVADDEDWPKGLYRRLGFDEIGRLYKFVTP
jgi:ribosomal protein S18 acetylase RimI-like enzyme